ncbi:solute carrier family 25 member 40 [Exaiptasia diaphana]|uniref:Solute carrier family 25 member 40 n=1 Tax=Exaiptasia diaphana TaxID=2652724 RepID=A0A913YAA2_EXADI|nr:solute carrier family 25 member 40 [Exaiptasia diaphana]KXJ28349.1 Solute carrier family 25 member 40 [Exaiptasia diaphana]
MTSLTRGDITPVQQMIASGSGAIVTSLFVTPLDVIKTRLQAQAKTAVQNRCYIFCNGLMDHLCLCSMLGSPYNPLGHVPPLKFSSSLDAFIKIVRHEGTISLWRGLPPTLVMAVPNTMIYFTLYDQLKVLYGFQQGETNVWSPILSGSSSRTISVTIISPIEMIRTKLQSRSGYKYKELGSVIRTAIQQGGVFSLWQGLGPTLLRDLPFSAIYWTGYEFLRSRTAEPGFWTAFISGAGSGLVAAILTQPFDVVKTHRQMELGEMEFSSPKRLPFTASILMKLYREKGFSSLFAGLAPRMAKVPPACAIMISIYEYGKTFFIQHNLKRRESLSMPLT